MTSSEPCRRATWHDGERTSASSADGAGGRQKRSSIKVSKHGRCSLLVASTSGNSFSSSQALGRRRSLGVQRLVDGRAARTSEDILKEMVDLHLQSRQKDDRDCNDIRRALERNPVCAGLSFDELGDLVMAAEYFVFREGECVCQQGDPATHLFVVREGSFKIVESGGTVGSVGAGSVFGELALVHDCLRTQSVVVTSESGSLWGVERMDFRKTLRSLSARSFAENQRLLESVSVFGLLTEPQRRAISEAMRPQSFKIGAVIVRAGEAGDCLFIVKSGTLSVRIKDQEVRRLTSGKYFGERSLLYKEPRSATVVCLEDAECVSIGETDLQKILKTQSLQQLLARNICAAGLQSSLVFSEFQARQLEHLCESAVFSDFAPGSFIHGTGAKDPKGLEGVRFFIVIDGFVEVTDINGSEATQLARGGTFGDEYVLDPKRRFMHTVRGVGTGAVQLALLSTEALACSLGSIDFGETLEDQKKERVLQKIHIFRHLADHQKRLLVRKFVERKGLKVGQKVVTQGELGSAFFIIKEGEVKVSINERLIRTMGKHDYFGERALLYDEPRTASVVISREGTTLWEVNKQVFLEVIHGPMLEYLEYRIRLQDTTVSLEDIEEQRVIGKGTFGVVKLVEHKKTKTRYALKVLMRSKIKELKQEDNIILEKEILAENDHPFIIKCVKVFEEPDRICFLTELISGGELLDVIDELEILDRKQAQFYTGSIGLAIDSLHERHIAYRDLKPENVLLDHRGNTKLIDFGCARKMSDGYAYTVVGTPHYMAPEVLVGKGYDISADLWSLGVCLYEFMCGQLPFANDSDTEQEVFRAILKCQLQFPDHLEDPAAKAIVQRLLTKDPKARAGSGLAGFTEIQEDPFFKDFDWDALLGLEISSPYVPKKESYSMDNEEASEACSDESDVSSTMVTRTAPEASSDLVTQQSQKKDNNLMRRFACFAWCSK